MVHWTQRVRQLLERGDLTAGVCDVKVSIKARFLLGNADTLANGGALASLCLTEIDASTATCPSSTASLVHFFLRFYLGDGCRHSEVHLQKQPQARRDVHTQRSLSTPVLSGISLMFMTARALSTVSLPKLLWRNSCMGIHVCTGVK